MNEDDTEDTWLPLDAAVEKVLARTREALDKRAGQTNIIQFRKREDRREESQRRSCTDQSEALARCGPHS
jgi:hypothetical protein